MEYIVKIAECVRKTNLKYKNLEKPWSYLIERNRNPVRTTETTAEYQKLGREQKDATKDHGGFVGGWLKGGRRLNGHVIMRTVGMLDADHVPAEVDFLALAREKLGAYEYFIYSTHSHTPETPRYRLALLLRREVSAEEYTALMRMVAKQIGMDYFDDSTYQATRMMYWASCSSDADFVFELNEGAPLNPDIYLAMYEDWRDVTQWPTSSRQSEIIPKSAAKQQDPLTKEGLVGVFNRTYMPIGSAISEFLSDVYTPSEMDGRYNYIPADSVAGVVIYDDKFAYSFHASDPGCEKLLNAFDLVRVHKFGEMSEKDSYKAMCDFAQQQPAVKELLAKEREEQARYDFAESDDEWKSKLTYMPRSKLLENSVWNLRLILTNDPDFAGFGYNEMAHRIQITGKVPWDRPENNPYWRDADTAQLKTLIDVKYLPFSSRNHDVCFTKVADDRRFHPIRDYLDNLPSWDGVPRIESLFVRCLQAEDSPYIRAVSRKTFAAAVARIYNPGIKFDCVPVFDGAQGIGKSSLFKELVGDSFYSETLSLTDMDDKAGSEKLQGYWVVEIGELAGMKKADIEKVKAFLSTSDDNYRPSYGRVVESHPRQCIIIATVNGERGYLRDITGNRRFWVVKCHQEEQVKRWHFTAQERDLIWAEAKHLYESGEKLYLDSDLIPEAELAQRKAMEIDERQGMVEEYLKVLLPEDWDSRDMYSRRSFIADQGSPLTPKGTVRRTAVSNIEIWCECFGKNPTELKPADSYTIAALMTRVEGWERSNTIRKISNYGRQRLYLPTGERT